MLFKLLVILHTLGTTVWTGGHVVLALTVLPQALKHRDPIEFIDLSPTLRGWDWLRSYSKG